MENLQPYQSAPQSPSYQIPVAELQSFPTLFDMPILNNIGIAYTVGKLPRPAFQIRDSTFIGKVRCIQ